MNIWIPKRIINLATPTMGLKLLHGQVCPRVLTVKDQFMAEVNRILDMRSRGVVEHLIPPIDPSWFTVARVGAWSPNLLTTQGKIAMTTNTYANWWRYYLRGIGTATPTVSDTGLSSYISTATSLTSLPSGTYANVHDYTNGVIKHRRAWLFPQQTTQQTYTEGGLSSSSSSNLAYTHALLATPMAVAVGEYYSPMYELEWQITPTVNSATIASPVLPGWATSAQARFETLFPLLEPFSTATGESLSNTTSVNPEYASEIGLDSSFESGYFGPSSSNDIMHAYHNSQLRNLLWPNNTSPSAYENQDNNGLRLFVSTNSDALTFSSSPKFVYTGGNITNYERYQNSSIWEEEFVTKGNAVLSQQSYTVSSGVYSRIQRKVLDSAHMNLSGIRSFGVCVHRSPLGISTLDVQSVFRVLLADPMVKDSDHILTLDMTQTWS